MSFITNNILKNPPILLGLISMLGLIIQRKNLSDILKGGLIAAFGMLILSSGVNMLIGAIAPINTTFSNTLSAGAIKEGLNDISFTQVHGGEVGLAMFIGLGLHLLIARFTRVKTIFLTGHMIWWFPFIFVAAGVEGGLSGISLILFGAIISALYWSFMPWVMRNYVWDATGDKSFLIGHPTGILSLVSGFVAKRLGDKSKSTEDLRLPKNLSFFREISITGCIVIIIMYLVIGLILPSILPEGQNLLMYSIQQGLSFGAGLLVMLYGVRMLINQIIPAFQGISEKVIPNAIPAFDCPILFNYKPNAVIIGFIVAMITSTVLIIISNTFNLFGVVLVPLVITSFFECGSASVIGEGQGGLKGSIIGTFIASIVMVLIMAVSVIIFKTTIQNWLLIFGGNDFSIFGAIAKFISEFISLVL
ncbi:PTS ascorbate transporter subunit IIC [Helcococcus ovis]|uniref:Ascorbate-specific PTS system EIIC component n=1 Tax=Helcococcus ovis TaxID=72026 RepID=A0A4V3IY60_9FIRM|nr:PTS ascorbate transporter subunit IIC [Helcococcus ovis]TFF63949.1 PTS ascorbate transporter subunit IIC [Helcococcus ovis]TFF64997.1 PTS ascorbate transporter subunit IIC [Helcococcus ovis]TFF68666.1 PTS ascorbate transporter subunit IIC [Helcococcus ovis]WNZ01606.1 PTS ascorbate transporter subunit IIC [Helcococcus ovis]